MVQYQTQIGMLQMRNNERRTLLCAEVAAKAAAGAFSPHPAEGIHLA
jgi:hypothetical protein